MAGRLLPIALAMISGIAIGISTFDGEFKAQQKKRLEEEYQRDLEAATASSTGASSPPPPPTAVSPPSTQQVPPKETSSTGSSWSSMLGLWAWRKKNVDSRPPPAQPVVQEDKGKP